MKTIASATLALLLLARPEAANAQNRTAVDAGRDLYQYSCAICHGRGSGNPGTVALQAKYGGKSPALLEERTDLTAAGVRFLSGAASRSCRSFARRKSATLIWMQSPRI